MTYGTTALFLEYFGLRSLEDLPAADELRRIRRAKARVALTDGRARPGDGAAGTTCACRHEPNRLTAERNPRPLNPPTAARPDGDTAPRSPSCRRSDACRARPGQHAVRPRPS